MPLSLEAKVFSELVIAGKYDDVKAMLAKSDGTTAATIVMESTLHQDAIMSMDELAGLADDYGLFDCQPDE